MQKKWLVSMWNSTMGNTSITNFESLSTTDVYYRTLSNICAVTWYLAANYFHKKFRHRCLQGPKDVSTLKIFHLLQNKLLKVKVDLFKVKTTEISFAPIFILYQLGTCF